MRKIKKARKVMQRAFEKDLNFLETYVSNVAMLLHDKYGITNYVKRDQAARDILRLIFW